MQPMTQDIRIKQGQFKQGMRRLASGVSIIASEIDGRKVGLAATSLTSLSADPPTLIVCINRGASAHDDIIRSGRFSANVLSSDQQDVAETFSCAARRGERFKVGTWVDRTLDVPVLENCAVNFECEIMEARTFSSHSIVIGRIVDTAFWDEDFTSLVYLDGAYCGTERLPALRAC